MVHLVRLVPLPTAQNLQKSCDKKQLQQPFYVLIWPVTMIHSFSLHLFVLSQRFSFDTNIIQSQVYGLNILYFYLAQLHFPIHCKRHLK